ncbi:Nuclear cap-binding protein subunit [Echinococcus granulosus]|uniref:Nuclear cap-binding protein subunit n=1 Tax=Echinococcus granulosus TaxID=6210 RepID=W6UR31_ECHGR|nr:Nuclear cap-binding protein subunit [Echinococcus granulosus]EUB60777.1 Nuclear cap-binding protein subunit [Echinococcus granulosus]
MSRKRHRDSSYDTDCSPAYFGLHPVDKFYPKRGRPDRDTIESLVYRIGSKATDKIHKDISELCILFCAELDKNLEHRIKLITSCAKNIPERMQIYTTLLGLINLKNHDFVSRAVDAIVRDLRDALKSSSFDDVKYLVRFLSNSVNCNIIHPASLLSLYENFAEVTLDVCSSSQARTDWYSFVVLSALPYITPPDYDSEIVYPLPQVVFRMFDYTDVYCPDDDVAVDGEKARDVSKISPLNSPTLPGAHTIERFLVDDQIHIILETMHFNRIMCARTLLNLQTRAKLALDYMIVEAIFADIFRLPKPPVRHGNLLFYASLLIQLCNEAVNTIPLVLAQATGILFERLDSMKPVCIARFVEWFSFHLTNYQLKWSWRDWSLALGEPVMSPRRWFISETLCRLVRYSYYENVKQRLPRSFYCLLPPQPGPINPYDKASTAQRRIFIRVLEAFHQRHSSDDLLNLIRRLASQRGDDFDDSDLEPYRQSRSRSRSGSSNHPHHSNSYSETEGSVEMDGRDQRSRPAAHRHLDGDKRGGSRSNSSASSASATSEKSRPVKNELTSSKRARNKEKMEDNEDDFDNCLVPGVTNRELELFMTALLYRAHKTISHTCSLLNRYSEAFKTLASTVELQVEALHILQAVWCNQSQMVVAISDYMSRQGMLDPESVVGWAFSPFMSAFCGPLAPPPSTVHVCPRMLQSHVWECLMHTLVRVGQRIAQITPRLEAVKDQAGVHHRKSASGSRSDGSSSDLDNDYGDGDLRTKIVRVRRRHQRHCRVGSHGSSSGGGGGTSPDRLARLKEERGEAVRSQCAVITLLLHRHVRLVATVEAKATEEMGAPDNPSDLVDLASVAYWLKGRLMQTVLEHQDQLLPYMDNLEELMSDLTPFVGDVFQALRSLYT